EARHRVVETLGPQQATRVLDGFTTLPSRGSPLECALAASARLSNLRGASSSRPPTQALALFVAVADERHAGAALANAVHLVVRLAGALAGSSAAARDSLVATFCS